MMKQLPIRGKKKIPQVQKGFLENKQNSFPVRREKGFDIQVLVLGKGACCAVDRAGNRREESCREKTGGKR